jgi:hypothetical protein
VYLTPLHIYTEAPSFAMIILKGIIHAHNKLSIHVANSPQLFSVFHATAILFHAGTVALPVFTT